MDWFLYDNGLRRERINKMRKVKDVTICNESQLRDCLQLMTIEIYIAIFIQVTNNDIVIFIDYWTNRIEKQPEFPCRM